MSRGAEWKGAGRGAGIRWCILTRALPDNVIITLSCPHYADNLCRSLRDARTHMSCFRVRIYERGAYICGRATFVSSTAEYNRHLTQIARVIVR